MNEMNLSVLIVEDEEIVRDTLVDFLEDLDYTVYQAENGRVGLALFKEKQPDIILTDLRMPEMDGITLLAEIQEISTETPIIVVSGTGDISDSVQALKTGAWDYIIKPIYDLSIVTVAISKAMEKLRLIQANRQYQENLENLVKERTEALEDANTRLSTINKRLRQLIESTGELAKCDSVDLLATRMMEVFKSHMSAMGGSLFYVNENGLQRAYTSDPQRVPDVIPFPLKKYSVIWHVFETGEPVLIKDLAEKKDVQPFGRDNYQNDSVLAFPILNENGAIVGIVTLYNKIKPPFVEQDQEIGSILATFGRETLRAVQNSETVRVNAEQQRIILNSLHTGIIVVDPETETIVDANSEAERIIGLSEDKIIGRSCHNFICLEDQNDCLALNCDSPIDNVESVVFTHDHREIPVLRTVTPIELRGRKHYLESFVDISAKKEIEKEKERLESQLVQSQKMEAIGTLAGGLAHDLNNTLNGIISPTSMLLQKMENNAEITSDRLKTQLERIEYAGSRITDMVSQLMAVSQKHELALASVDLNLSLKHITKLARGTFDKSIQIVTHPYEKPAMTSADPTRIEQVILNLCINASHAMTLMRPHDEKWGGKLEMELKLIHVDTRLGTFPPEIRDGDFWRIEISDTGVGIPEENLIKIFTPFFTTKDKSQGTGLGLAMVFNIVQQHHGVITVDSNPGVGSMFSLYLPVMTTSSPIVPEKADYQSLRGTANILIVDDEKCVRDVMAEILSELGYSVSITENGEQAVEFFKKNQEKIDLVLLDLIMPKMSGDEAYYKMKEIQPNIPILIVSGFKQDRRIQELFEKDQTPFLQKPFDLYSLAEAVKSAL